MYDFQRASMLRRAPAWLFDVILLITLATGVIAGLGYILNWDAHADALDQVYVRYEEKYGISFSVTQEDLDAMTEEAKLDYEEKMLAAQTEMDQDPEAQKAYEMVLNLTLVMLSVGTLIPYLLLEFLVPLLFKNGQTLGKKIFGVALMRKDGVKVTPFMMFTRTILGKYTVETMIPILLLVASIFSILGWLGPIIVLLFTLVQVILTLATKNKTAIHDIVACTVSVDMSSQMIFESVEEMEAYNEEIRNYAASKAE